MLAMTLGQGGCGEHAAQGGQLLIGVSRLKATNSLVLLVRAMLVLALLLRYRDLSLSFESLQFHWLLGRCGSRWVARDDLGEWFGVSERGEGFGLPREGSLEARRRNGQSLGGGGNNPLDDGLRQPGLAKD
jgi:hypothetical protein